MNKTDKEGKAREMFEGGWVREDGLIPLYRVQT